jgi:GNAT superfamily N-acetyltransferase
MSELPPAELPEHAPATLHDGRHILIRPLTIADVAALQSGLERLSPASRYQRFMGSMPRLSDTQARYFADVDGVHHVAFGASDPAVWVEDDNPEGLGIGTARYIRGKHDPTIADLAVTVVDDYQRLGLGGILLDHLIEHARDNGVRSLHATMFSENRAIQALLRSRRFTIQQTDDGSVVTASLDLETAPDTAHD